MNRIGKTVYLQVTDFPCKKEYAFDVSCEGNLTTEDGLLVSNNVTSSLKQEPSIDDFWQEKIELTKT